MRLIDAPPLLLIGMMGAGKSTIGRNLARLLDVPFIDADRALEERSGVPIPTIFELEGEDGFRRREAALIESLSQERGVVVATGGGAVLLEENCRYMHDRGIVVYLEASLDELQRRLRHDRQRPLLQSGDANAKIAQLHALRAPLYRACAHITFASGSANPKRLARRIADTSAVVAAYGPLRGGGSDAPQSAT